MAAGRLEATAAVWQGGHLCFGFCEFDEITSGERICKVGFGVFGTHAVSLEVFEIHLLHLGGGQEAWFSSRPEKFKTGEMVALSVVGKRVNTPLDNTNVARPL